MIRDLLHAARSLTKARAFTLVCVVSLGLGMSVVIATLLLMRFVLATPPLVDDAGLVEPVIRPAGALRAQAGSAIIDTWSYPDYLDVREFSGMALTGWTVGDGLLRMPTETTGTPVLTMYVSSNYFALLGVSLSRGSGFSPVSDASRAQPEAVISHRQWQLKFNSDPNVIGRTVAINQSDYVIVGVAPEGFRGHVGGLSNPFYGLWLPLSDHPRLHGQGSVTVSREAAWVRLLGRLPPGTSVAQADATMQAGMAGLAARYPATNAEKVGGVETYFAPGARLRSQITAARMMALVISGMVLLVVGLNISGMMLVRSAMRERELAVRLAIGASRWRLMRYHLTEAVVMALFGGSFAAALLFGVPILVGRAWDVSGPQLDLFKPDVWLLVQCLALCFATSLVLGLLPAVRFSRPTLLSALKSDSAGSGRRVGRLQRFTAALQAGLAVPFLVFGGVKLDQARVTLMADPGFQPRGLYAVPLNLSAIGNTDAERELFVRTVRETLQQAPGVRSVSIADGVPLDAVYRNARIARAGDSSFVTAHSTRVGADYFDTLGIGLLAGRALDDNDRSDGERVVVLSQPLARRLFPGSDPLGQRVTLALSGNDQQPYTVVGITADLVSTDMGSPRPQLFLSLAQHPVTSVLTIARGLPADPSIRRAFEEALTTADADVVPPALITGESLVDNGRADYLSQSAIGGVGATVALVLAALGVYGVTAFMVAARTREIGVRVALGASRVRVLRDVLGAALTLVVPGIALGLVVAVFWTRVADPSWYPLGGVEPLIYSSAATIALVVAAMAGLPSARRAARVQPIIAMRTD